MNNKTNFIPEVQQRAAFLLGMTMLSAEKHLRSALYEKNYANYSAEDVMYGGEQEVVDARFEAIQAAVEEVRNNHDWVNYSLIPTQMITPSMIGLLHHMERNEMYQGGVWLSAYHVIAGMWGDPAFMELFQGDGHEFSRFYSFEKFVDVIYRGEGFLKFGYDHTSHDMEYMNYFYCWTYAWNMNGQLRMMDFTEPARFNSQPSYYAEPSAVGVVRNAGLVAACSVLPNEVVMEFVKRGNFCTTEDAFEAVRHVGKYDVELLLRAWGFPTQFIENGSYMQRKWAGMVSGGLASEEFKLIEGLAHDVALAIVRYNSNSIKGNVVTYCDMHLYERDEDEYSGYESIYGELAHAMINRKNHRQHETNNHDPHYTRICYLIRQLGKGIFDDIIEQEIMDNYEMDLGGLKDIE